MIGKSLTVDGVPVKVRVLGGLETTKRTGGVSIAIVGSFDAKTGIVLRAAQTRGEMRDTFLHEVMHACWLYSGLKTRYKASTEELVVAQMAPYLLTVLRENPWVVDFLTEGDA